MSILYWAFGSNLSARQMRERCPNAKKVRALIVDDAKLVFRGVADVTYEEGAATPGGLWEITDRCERTLDIFEGISTRTYLKRYMKVKIKGKVQVCLFYQMSISKGVMPPSERYLDTIAEGYRDFGLDLADLDAALQRSWDDKLVTNRLAQKHYDRGSPRLARPVPLANPTSAQGGSDAA